MGCCCSSSNDGRVNITDDFNVILTDNVNNTTFQQDYKLDQDVAGRKTWTLDLRRGSSNGERRRNRPDPPRGEMWTDPEFPLHVAVRDYKKHGLQWKRPHEIIADPVLFHAGTSRFDIKQKHFGTCWFLNIVATLADKPDICSKVINETSYTPGPRGDGVSHIRLWRFGEWVSVYTDDHLPVYARGRLYHFYGAMSGTDIGEMWVPLLEKALARLHGSYNVVSERGGYPSDGYLTLTGGLAERLNLDREHPDPHRLFSRIRNALRSGALICCGVPNKFNDEQGLMGGHAYSLTGADVVKLRGGEQVPLLRIRNPHGQSEWTGRWSDKSSAWGEVESGSDLRKNRHDGEFWIGLEDFMQYFPRVFVCSLSPDFDLDGHTDSLDHMLQVYGEWAGGSAVGEGRSLRMRLRNPRIEIHVPHEGVTEDGFVPMVIQILQKGEHLDYEGIRCDLFRVYRGREDSASMYLEQVPDQQGKDHYYSQLQCCFRYRLRPGRHIVIPSMYEKNRARQYLLRIFTSCALPQCRILSGRIRLIPK